MAAAAKPTHELRIQWWVAPVCTAAARLAARGWPRACQRLYALARDFGLYVRDCKAGPWRRAGGLR